MNKDDLGCLSVILFFGLLILGFGLLLANPSIQSSEAKANQNIEFRRICAEAGGTALTDTSELKDVCVKEFITIRQGNE